MRNKCVLLGLITFLLLSTPAAAHPSVQLLDYPWLVLRAFLVSYPDKISGVDYDSSVKDWFLTIEGKRLYWAGGRLLPESELANIENWRPYVDYLYPDEIPDPSKFSSETISRLNATGLAESRSNSKAYNISFYDSVYDGATRQSIESHVVRFDYLGKRVSVHTYIVPALKRVEVKLNTLALSDSEVKTFISSITSIDGYNWREIADRPTRSNHSWGFALDILPANWGKKNIYWNWLSYWNDDWMLIPLDRRWMPPAAVVTAFESEGFIWGGKWLLWDNMHFEYRPELITLKKWGYEREVEY